MQGDKNIDILKTTINFYQYGKILCNVLFDCRNEHVELVPLKPNVIPNSKLTEVNMELSNYANNFESNVNSDNISLIKSPTLANSMKRYQKHQSESFKKNISNGKINNTFNNNTF